LADRVSTRLAARQWRESAAESDLAALIQTTKGVAQLRAGEISSARETLSVAAHSAQETMCKPLAVSAGAQFALAAALEGRLCQAREWARRSISVGEESGMSAGAVSPAAEIALAWVAAEQHDLRAARDHIQAAHRSPIADPVERGLCALVRARLLRAGGEGRKAIALIDDARNGLLGKAVWLADLLRIEATEAAITIGDLELAVREADALQQASRAATALVLGHLQLVRGDWEAVAESVAEILRRDESGAAIREVVGGRLLQVAHQLHRGHDRQARVTLALTLRLAAAECMRRPFREAAPSVREMLQDDLALHNLNPWLAPALVPRLREPRVHLVGADGLRSPDTVEVREPLTAKEQEVLGHLSEMLTTSEIAAAMFVSVNTVRTHVRNILRKLGASRRSDAVRRARALSLIAA
jgi:LuxR family maltose regulon positive regulatory protein